MFLTSLHLPPILLMPGPGNCQPPGSGKESTRSQPEILLLYSRFPQGQEIVKVWQEIGKVLFFKNAVDSMKVKRMTNRAGKRKHREQAKYGWFVVVGVFFVVGFFLGEWV